MGSDKMAEAAMSSDEDDTLLDLVKRRRMRAKPPGEDVQDTTRDAETAAAMAEFLRTALPRRLVPGDIAAYIRRESNERLAMARAAAVTTEEIYIGDDCLPTWRGMAWDPEAESLHSVIQSRLVDLEVAQELGAMLRREMITKGNRRLEEARRLGVGLADIFVGESLLASWGHETATTTTTVDGSLRETCSVDSGEDEREVDNVVYGVEAVDVPVGFREVDLEIYVAEDDEDVDELPVLELSVDRAAWEYWVGDEGGVDVEIVDEGVQYVEGDGEEDGADVDEDGWDRASPRASETSDEEHETFNETADGFEW